MFYVECQEKRFRSSMKELTDFSGYIMTILHQHSKTTNEFVAIIRIVCEVSMFVLNKKFMSISFM